MAASSLSEGENRYAAAWERDLAAGSPEDLEDLGATWEGFWATQAVEPVGAFVVPYEVGGADVAASLGDAGANQYAAAWQSYLAMENPQSLALVDYGDTWALFWASVGAGGFAETDEGFEVFCCR